MSKVNDEVRAQLVKRVMDAGASYACGMLIHHGAKRSKGQSAKEALNEALQELLREAIAAGIEVGYDMGEKVFGDQ